MEDLPIHLQSRILGLLPITTLVLCKAVSHSWRSIIRSPAFIDFYHLSRDPIFLFLSDETHTVTSSGYLPSADRWIQFHFPEFVNTSAIATEPSAVARTLILTEEFGQYVVINPFSRDRPRQLLPPVFSAETWHRALALIEDSPSDYTVVVASSTITQTYHSRSGRWEHRGHIGVPSGVIDLQPRGNSRFRLRASAVCHDGKLYCLSRCSNRFLIFDLLSGQWRSLGLDLPMRLFSSRLVSFGGGLYLVASVRDRDRRSNFRVGIWKLDQSTMSWREFDFIGPDEYLAELGVKRYDVVHCMGMICFGNYDLEKILMYDLAERKYWWSQPCNTPRGSGLGFWVGQSIEPRIELLK